MSRRSTVCFGYDNARSRRCQSDERQRQRRRTREISDGSGTETVTFINGRSRYNRLFDGICGAYLGLMTDEQVVRLP